MTYTLLEPTAFEDLIFQSDIARKKLESYAKGLSTGNILLHGPYGSSKSTAAKIVANEVNAKCKGIFDFDVDLVNGADFEPESLQAIERGWHLSGHRFTYAVIDEFDLVQPRHQAKVRALLDKYRGRYGIIFTTNHLHRVDGAIQSRCEVIEMPALDAEKLVPLCKRFLAFAGISLNDGEIIDAIAHEQGDIRRVLRQLERIAIEVKQRPAA